MFLRREIPEKKNQCVCVCVSVCPILDDLFFAENWTLAEKKREDGQAKKHAPGINK